MKALVIIPAYNEEGNILNTVKDLKKCNKAVDYVIINDGSTDRTRAICEKNNLNFIDLPCNLGIGGAVQTGYKYALRKGYDVAIQYDGDGQHNPKYIRDLIHEIEAGNDLVIGSRYIEKISDFQSTFIRRVGINFLSSLIKARTRKKIYDVTSGFRACNKKLIKLFSEHYPSDYPEPDSLTQILKAGYRVSEIPVEMNERKTGKSSIGALDSIYYMIKVSFCIITASYIKKEDTDDEP